MPCHAILLKQNPCQMLVLLSLEVLIMHTKELGQILAAVHQTSTNLGRMASIPTMIMIMQLVLKHCSLLEDTSPDTEHALVHLAKKPQKNNIGLNIVAFGDGIEDASKGGHSILHAFVKTASSDNSHLSSRHYLAVPPVSHLSSIIFNSPILAGDCGIPDELVTIPGCVGGAAGTGGVSHFSSGIDPSLDPELAMVLQMSMEEATQQWLPMPNCHQDLMEEEIIMQAIMMSMHPEAESDMQGMWKKSTAAREAAELANRSTSEFLANMSHKIRLAWWIGYLENWSDDHGESLLLTPADYFRNPTLVVHASQNNLDLTY
ncbi:hypothetical protein F5148DRAFT_1155025 [Russula earlei]|uniref:Uncharacterized protein n=1 Tax=Russula earlei TaxID=71964 RepID=A0ACC0TQI9_9AGAM|nr:hypothetical protein F5148DRAFT_1155025 [Russula earlei]